MPWDRLSQRLQGGETATLLADLIDHCAAQPSHAEAHHALGVLLLRLQQPLDAKACWQRCLTLEPAHQAARLQLAQLMIRIGEPKAALRLLKQSPHPPTPESNTLRGLASLQTSANQAKAARALERALQWNPAPTERLWLYGWQIAAGLVLNGRHQAATTWLEALDCSPQHQRLVRMLRLLSHQPRQGDLDPLPADPVQTTEQRVWTRLGPALLRASHPALADAEQLLLHPDPQLLQLAQHQRADLLKQMLQRRGLHQRPDINRRSQKRPVRRWLLLASNALPQCFQFRVLQKQQQLEALGWESRIVLEENLGTTKHEPLLAWADALIICRLKASAELLDWLQAARARDVPCFYDIDDLLFDPQHSPPPLTNYAGRLPPELHRRFVIDAPLITEVMRCCDAVIVSTATLKERWTALNIDQAKPQPLVVLPNLAPPELWNQQVCENHAHHKASLRLVIASGNSTHLRCWREELAPALAQLMRRHPRLELSLLGELRAPLPLLEHHKRIQHQNTLSYPDYIQAIANNDIGLMVLESGVFSDGKSANRWMEFSLSGLASVMSPTRTLTELLTNNEHALFARGKEQWVEQIERLIHNPDLKQRLALQARAHARRLFDPTTAGPIWAEMASLACQVTPTCFSVPPGTTPADRPPNS